MRWSAQLQAQFDEFVKISGAYEQLKKKFQTWNIRKNFLSSQKSEKIFCHLRKAKKFSVISEKRMALESGRYWTPAAPSPLPPVSSASDPMRLISNVDRGCESWARLPAIWSELGQRTRAASSPVGIGRSAAVGHLHECGPDDLTQCGSNRVPPADFVIRREMEPDCRV